MSSKEIVCLVADLHLLAEVEQCAAVLGFSLIDGLMDAALASRWRSADAVVADCEGLDEVSSLSLPPRRGVFVVCAGTPPWERGVQVGAEDVMVLPARSGDLVEALSTRCSRNAVSGGWVAVVSPSAARVEVLFRLVWRCRGLSQGVGLWWWTRIVCPARTMSSSAWRANRA